MKIGAFIISCGYDQKRGCHDVIRETYGSWEKIPCYFFVGENGVQIPEAECKFNVDDSYHGLYKKTTKVIEFAVWHDYDHIFLCDVDTYINVPNLLKSGFEKYDYMGWRCDEGHAGQGHGMWLSNRACRYLAANPCQGGHFDLYAGTMLARHGITLKHDPRFLPFMPKPDEVPTFFSAHLGRGTGTYQPQWMRDCHGLVTS